MHGYRLCPRISDPECYGCRRRALGGWVPSEPEDPTVTVHDIELQTLAGEPATLGRYAGSVVLAVNVASECGLTPQYVGLQRLHERSEEHTSELQSHHDLVCRLL